MPRIYKKSRKQFGRSTSHFSLLSLLVCRRGINLEFDGEYRWTKKCQERMTLSKYLNRVA
ncbi:MAG: hypothetical protein D4R77_05450 [Planctomycetaceae bacterium]|nr:MAG: hypothetical protein D4R77_05450 [Planctomycetaceae bacterium]